MKHKRILLAVILLIISIPAIVFAILASNDNSKNANNTNATYFKYTVQPGDTCAKIAIEYSVSIMSIIIGNGLKTDCSDIFIGQELKIFHPTATPTGFVTSERIIIECDKENYTVKTGDTLEGISSKFDVPEKNIMDFNGLSNKIIYSGMQLVIPLCPATAKP